MWALRAKKLIALNSIWTEIKSLKLDFFAKMEMECIL